MTTGGHRAGPPRGDLRHDRQPRDDLQDHRRDPRRHGGLAEPAPRTGHLHAIRDDSSAGRSMRRDQGPWQPGRQPARLCGHRLVDLDGQRDVLGLWLGPSGGEGAKQWATMLTELRNPRRVADALIVCCDGTHHRTPARNRSGGRGPGLEATVQTCVVHMVRNSLRYTRRRSTGPRSPDRCAPSTRPPPSKPPRPGSTTSPRPGGRSTPAMIGSWENLLGRVRAVPRLPWPSCAGSSTRPTPSNRSTPSSAEGVRHRGHFPNEQSAMKVLYLIATRRRPNRQDLTGQIRGWKPILEHPDHPLRRPHRSRRLPTPCSRPTYTKNH